MSSPFESMDDRQKQLAKDAKSKEELNGVLESGSMSLSADQLDAVSGGRIPYVEEDNIMKEAKKTAETGKAKLTAETGKVKLTGEAGNGKQTGDAREGVDPELADKSLSEGRLTGADFFA